MKHFFSITFFVALLCYNLLNLKEMDAQNVTLKIITTSDVHGALFPYDFIENQPVNYSLAQVASYVKRERQRPGQQVVLLDNGDILQGQPTVYYYNFIQPNEFHLVADMLNYMQYDAATVGNHDIEAGHPVYDRLVGQFQFPWLAANAIDSTTQKPYFQPYTIIEKEGIKIAVLGLITPAIPQWLPRHIWAGMYFDDMIESARHWEQVIRETEQPDLLIGLFHSGIDYTYNSQNETTYRNENASKLIAMQVPGFDIIFAGHDHQPYNSFIATDEGDSLLLLDTKNAAKAVAVATVQMNRNTETGQWQKNISGEVVEMDAYPPDSLLMKTFSYAYDEVEQYVAQPVAKFTKTISTREAMFGNSAFIDLIHQVQLDETQADISFASPLSFNAEIAAGTISVRDMFKLYRFDNLLYTMRLTGEEIHRYLEFSFGKWFNHMQNENDHLLLFDSSDYFANGLKTQWQYYNFSTAAGINYTVDVSQPAGQRVQIQSLADGTPFSMEKEYRVAVNSYRGNGGGNHLTSGAGISEEELPERIVEVSDNDLRFSLMQWLEEQDTVTPFRFNNWKVIPESWWEKGRKKDESLLYGN